MIDGLFKHRIDRFWEALAKFLVVLGLTPNQVTWLGLIAVLANCVLYPLHQNNIAFGLLLGATFALDALDGAVARLTNSASRYGGYLDAVVDRYQEFAVYLTLAWVHGWWPSCFLALTGSLLISYNKARTAVEIPIDNNRWPDLLERMERVIILCAALALDPFITLPASLGGSLLHVVIVLLAMFTHLTAFQRFWRARAMLREADGT